MLYEYKYINNFLYNGALVASPGDLILIVNNTVYNVSRKLSFTNKHKLAELLMPHLKEFKASEGNSTQENKDEVKIDQVNHPQHYTKHPSGVECIQIAEHYDFCIGNAIKYLWRAGLKSDESMTSKEKEIQDLQKAIWYINRKINALEK